MPLEYDVSKERWTQTKTRLYRLRAQIDGGVQDPAILGRIDALVKVEGHGGRDRSTSIVLMSVGEVFDRIAYISLTINFSSTGEKKKKKRCAPGLSSEHLPRQPFDPHGIISDSPSFFFFPYRRSGRRSCSDCVSNRSVHRDPQLLRLHHLHPHPAKGPAHEES